MYLAIHPNISIHKGEYYIIGTKESLKEATKFKDDYLYESGTKNSEKINNSQILLCI